MALITCTECGKQFSDRAKSCPSCGCPTSVILKELEKKKKSGSGRIIEKYDILGETFAVSEAMHRSLILSKCITEACDALTAGVEEAYWEEKSIDAVIEHIPSSLAEMLDELLDIAVQWLVEAGVYDIDKEQFYTKYEQEFDTSVLMTPIIDKYLEIMDLQDKIKEYHNYVAQSRKNVWRGGGFGFTGAIKGHIQAQLLNFGNAVLHSIPDSNRRSKDLAKIRTMKDNLYRDPKTIGTVISGFRYVASTVLMAMNHEMSAVGFTVELDFDPKRALSLLRNATERDNISEEQSSYMLREAFFANPLDATVIETILLFGLDESGGVEAFARQYGFYDPIYMRYQETLRKTHAKEIRALQEIKYEHPAEDFCKVVEVCEGLAESGLETTEYIMDAVGKCLRGYLSENDINTMTAALCEAGDSLGQELVENAVTMLITR